MSPIQMNLTSEQDPREVLLLSPAVKTVSGVGYVPSEHLPHRFCGKRAYGLSIITSEQEDLHRYLLDRQFEARGLRLIAFSINGSWARPSTEKAVHASCP